MIILLGVLIPFLGTSLGSSMVFIMKNEFSSKLEKVLLGLASGVMIAAAMWSLLIPAIELAKVQGIISWEPAVIGFVLGILFLIFIDYLISKIDKECKMKNLNMLFTAVTIHNIPERYGCWCYFF